MINLFQNDLEHQDRVSVYAKCRQQIDRLTEYLSKKRAEWDPSILKAVANTKKHNNELYTINRNRFQTQRYIAYPQRKMFALDWSVKHPNYIAIAGETSTILICNAQTCNKMFSIALPSWKVMTCSWSPTETYIASGGLNNCCEIYKLPHGYDLDKNILSMNFQDNDSNAWDLCHNGYVSCTQCIDDNNCISGSGDSTCILWDIPKKTKKITFSGHNGDVMAIQLNKDKSIFVSVGLDGTARIWDYRIASKCIERYRAHDDDINAVSWFPDNNAFGTASDDSTLKLFDLRSKRQLSEFGDHDIIASVTSCDFSQSGYYMFAGYDIKPYCVIWNTQTGDIEQKMDTEATFNKRVSCLQTSPDGNCVAVGTWNRRCNFLC